MKKTKQLAVSSIISSIILAALIMSSFLPLFKFSVCCLSAILITIVALLYKIKFAFFIYITTTIAGFFLVPEKTTFFVYVLFLGYYPIIYICLNNINNKILKISIKTIIFLVASILLNFFLFFFLILQNKLAKVIFPTKLFIISVVEYFFKFFILDCCLNIMVKKYYKTLRNFFLKNIK